MAEVEKLSLIQILAIKIKKMVGAQIIKRFTCDTISKDNTKYSLVQNTCELVL